MVLPRPTMFRTFAATTTQSIRTAGATSCRRSAWQLGRRTYATPKAHEMKKSSDLPWMIASIGLGAPTAAYLISTGPEKKPHYDHHRPVHKEEVEGGEKEEEMQAAAPEAAEEKEPEETPEAKQEPEDGKPSDRDKPAAMKSPGGPGTMSGKQEGVSNEDAMNPDITDPGKSVKGEGETESTKLKGTIDPKRPQA